MSNSQKSEKGAIFLILVVAAITGIYPIAVNKGTQVLTPLLFAALTALLAGVILLIYSIARKKLSEIKIKKAHVPILMVTLCIVVIPSILFFIGAKGTSGINTSFLLLSEIIFTLIFTPFFGEKTTVYKLLGAGGIFLGSIFILYNGSLSLNNSDLLVIVSTITFPIGNYYAKKALNLVSPEIILAFRFLIGGSILLVLSLLTEGSIDYHSLYTNWGYIVLTGVIIFAFTKYIWYEALKRVDISKSISLGMTSSLFSLVILVVFLKESVSLYQWIGIIFMSVGIYFSIKRKSIDPKLTKYAP